MRCRIASELGEFGVSSLRSSVASRKGLSRIEFLGAVQQVEARGRREDMTFVCMTFLLPIRRLCNR